jgi:hypothetical protein
MEERYDIQFHTFLTLLYLGEFHPYFSTTLHPVKESPLYIGQEAGWAQ